MFLANRSPCFRNLELVLEKKKPPRPVLFDFILGDRIERMLAGQRYDASNDDALFVSRIIAFGNAGYDYTPIIVRGLYFPHNESHVGGAQTKSLNEGGVIVDRESFDRYCWPELTACDFDILRRVGERLPDGMKLVPYSFDGVLENVVSIVGYETLCYMLYEDRALVYNIFEQVGKRLVAYFKRCLESEYVGAIVQNDDWGFNTQTFLSPQDMREFVFPWHKQIAEAAHAKGKYTILHSCGNYDAIIDDIIEDIKVDGRHSYQDGIVPVEQAYDDLHNRIAVLGGIDVDFLARRAPDEVFERCTAMLRRASRDGAYALGSGNSVPDYVPDENFLAMVRAALAFR